MRFLTALLALTIAGPLPAQRRARTEAAGEFAYYLLVLSYAPDFCAEPQGAKDARECGSGRRTGFVVHGLWPQGEESRGPERCGPARPVAESIVNAMLAYFPTPGLIQHEWTSHGTCSGMSAADYFAAVRRARDAVRIPPDLAQPAVAVRISPAEVEAKLAAANPAYPRAAFRTSCYRDGTLQEIRVCLARDLTPRACGRSAGECRAASLTLLPVR
jgi:ribonuclease T2